MERQGRNTPSERVRYGWVTLIEGRIPCPGEGYMLRTDRAFVGDGSQEQTSQDLGVLFQYCGRQFCPQIFRTSKSGRSAGTLMVQLKHHRVYRMPVRCTHGKSIELTRSEHSRGFGLISLNSPAQNH